MRLIKENIILKTPFKDYYTGTRLASLKPGKPLKISENAPGDSGCFSRQGIRFVIRQS